MTRLGRDSLPRAGAATQDDAPGRDSGSGPATQHDAPGAATQGRRAARCCSDAFARSTIVVYNRVLGCVICSRGLQFSHVAPPPRLPRVVHLTLGHDRSVVAERRGESTVDRRNAAVRGIEKTTLMVPMRDGVRLHTDFYVPRVRRAPADHLHAHAVRHRGRRARLHGAYAELARDGYIFVFQDIRGRFKSEGAVRDAAADARQARSRSRSTKAPTPTTRSTG